MILPSFKFTQGDFQKWITLPTKNGKGSKNGIKLVLILAFDQGN
jgi:hypothetical protein